MPMYKYLCEDCGEITKICRRMTEDKTPDKCIQCGSTKLRRVYSAVGISVNGASSMEAGSSCDSGICQRY
jgi:putative FmdB family regulatory protein